MKSPLALLFLITLVAGCTSESATTSSPALTADGSASRSVSVPASSPGSPPPSLPRTEPAGVASASSWGERLAGLPGEEARYLTVKNDSYFGALGYTSVKERDLLRQIGVPLPDDFLAARRLTSQELASAAENGDVRARLLYIDRLVDEAQGKSTSDTGIAGEEATALAARASFEIGKLKTQSNSAFIPYLDARLFTTGSDAKPEYVTGAMLAAMDRGDTRALGLLESYASEHPTVDVMGVALYFSTMKANDPSRQ
ncbi:hypothetical protein [Luteimonas sp. MHLX1A]|uniref:hypothetical protein n=1 Tax=Alterluteimonas muca TaxID=2878684 RepID=UPI001E2B8467|nr:hypothetical protein [Luteimonas sp. MHLX1A]MCD9046792.1 hypothetical protein [Luteimonas sp. MHLX1A]